MKRTPFILIVFTLLLCLSSCRVHKDIPSHYHSMTQRGNATLAFDNHKYSMGCTMQLWKNAFIIISLQPMLGIEMARIEADKDSVWVFDKMNKRYTALSYQDAEGYVSPSPNYKMIQSFIVQPTDPQASGKVSKTFTSGEHVLTIECSFSDRKFDTLTAQARLDRSRYKRVPLRTILPL